MINDSFNSGLFTEYPTGKNLTLEMNQEESFKELTELISEVWQLRKEAMELWRSLNEYISEAPHPLILRVTRELERIGNVPKPPRTDEELKDLISSLREYVIYSRQRLESMREYMRELRLLSEMLIEVEERAQLLKTWSEVIRDLEPRAYSEAVHALNKVKRIREYTDVKNLRILLKEVSEVHNDVESCLRLCQRIYERRLNVIKEQTETAIKLYRGARRLAMVTDVTLIDGAYSRLMGIMNALENAKRKAPFVDLDLQEMEKEVRGIVTKFRDLLDSAVGGREARVLKALSTLAPQYGEKALPFHVVVMQISRASELSVNEVLLTLYSLSKKGLAPVRMRLR